MRKGNLKFTAAEDGVKARCLEHFNSIEPTDHLRMTAWSLDPNRPDSLRQDVDQMGHGEAVMSPRLQAAVQALVRVPLDDCVCEGPHAQAKRLKMPASAAKWAWVASSMRLKQNLTTCKELATKTAPFRAAWTSWSIVVQPARKSQRVPKMKPKEVHRRLYRLDHLLGFSANTKCGIAGLMAIDDEPAVLPQERTRTSAWA